MRRLLVDQHGNPKAILKRGELKSLTTDRVLQIPGPPEEIKVVRDIFHWYAEDRVVARLIADRLNVRGIVSEYGRQWTRSMVQTLVTNPKYIGANVTNRKSYKHGGKAKANPRDRWIIREKTWEPLIDAEIFHHAQTVASSRNVRYSDQYLLDALRELLERTGKLTVLLIDEDPNMPNSRLYHQRFGSMFEAYRRIGYDRQRPTAAIELARRLRNYQRDLLTAIVAELTREGASVRRQLRSGLVTVNDEFTLRLAIASCRHKSVGDRWHFRLDTGMQTDVTVVARMAPANDTVLDYYLLPETDGWPTQVTVQTDDDLFVGIYRFDDLAFLKNLARRARLKEAE